MQQQMQQTNAWLHDVPQLLSAVDAGWLLHLPAAQFKQLVWTPSSVYWPLIQFLQVGASLAENGMYCPSTHAINNKKKKKRLKKKLIKYQKIKNI